MGWGTPTQSWWSHLHITWVWYESISISPPPTPHIWVNISLVGNQSKRLIQPNLEMVGFHWSVLPKTHHFCYGCSTLCLSNLMCYRTCDFLLKTSLWILNSKWSFKFHFSSHKPLVIKKINLNIQIMIIWWRIIRAEKNIYVAYRTVQAKSYFCFISKFYIFSIDKK